MAFNLSAVLSFQRQANIRPIISDIQKQLNRARFEISVHIDTWSIRQIEGILNRNARASDSFNASLSNVSNTATKLGQTLSGQKFNPVNLKALNSELAISKSRFQSLDSTSVKTFSGIAAQSYLAYRAVSLLTSQFNEFREYNSLLTKFAQVSGVSINKVTDLSTAVRINAVEFGTNSKELLDVATNLKRAGLSSDKVKESLRLFSKLSLSEGISDIKQVTQAYVILDRIFGQSSAEIEQSFNKITNLSAQFANEAEDNITALKIFGAQFHSLGGSLDEFNAIFTATQENSQQSASATANALKTIFARISSAPETISALNKVGISLTDLEGRFVGPQKAVEILVRELGKLDDNSTQKLEVLQKISGTRQLSVLSSLLNSYGRQLEATSILKEQSNKLDRDAAIAQQSLAVKIQSTAEVIKRDFAAIFENKNIIGFTDSVLGLTKALSGLLPVVAPLVPVIAALGVRSLANRSGIGGLASGGLGSIGASFTSGYSQPVTRAIPQGRLLPSPNVAAATRQAPIYARNPHFQSGLENIGGAFGDAFNKKSITQQITTVNKLSSQFADLSLTDKQLSGAIKHLVIQLNDGATLEQAVNETRKALARVQHKQAIQLGVQTSYAQKAVLPESRNLFQRTANGLSSVYRQHGERIGQGALAGGLILNNSFNKEGASKELLNTGLSTGLSANVLGANAGTSLAIGLGASLLNYSDIIENEAKRVENNAISSALDSLAIKIKLEGDKLGAGTLASGKGLLDTLNAALSNSRKEVGTTQAIIAGTKSNLGSLFAGDFGKLDGSLFGAKQAIYDDRGQQFQQTLRQSSDALLSFRQQILASGVKSLSEFESYGGGFGRELLGLLSHLDPAIRRTTENLISATDSKQLTEAIAYDLSSSISKSAVDVENKRRALSPAYKLGSGQTSFDATEIGTAAYSRQIGKLGLSKEIESTLRDINLVSQKGAGILAGGRDFGKDTFAESVANQLRQEGVADKVATAIQDSLEQAGYEKFRESLTDIEKASGDLLSQFQPLINSTERLRAAQLELVTTRNSNFSTAAGQYSQTVDANIQARLASLSVADSVSRYRKGPLDTGAGDLLARQGAIALGGSSDTVKLGHNLKLLSEQFEKTKDSRILEVIKQTEAALKLLGDTTLRTRNIEEELNKAKSQKEAKLGAAEAFLSQDRKGRLESLRGLGLAAQATRVGSLNGFDIPSQQKIIAALRSVSDVKLGNGLTGKENLENLIKNSLPGLVAPEEKNIADLTKRNIEIGISVAAATKELAINQERQLSNFLVGMGNENRAFLAGLGTLLGTPERLLTRRAAGGYVSGPGGPRSDSVPAMLSAGEFVINAASAARLGPERLNALNRVHLARGGAAGRAQRRQQYLQSQFAKTDAYIRSKRAIYEYPSRQSQFQDYSERFANFRNTTRLQRKYGNPNYGRKFADGGAVTSGGNIASGISSAMGQFQSSVLVLSQSVNELAKISIPSSIAHSGTFQHEVIINGASVLQNLLQGPLADLIAVEIDKSIRKHIPLETRISGAA